MTPYSQLRHEVAVLSGLAEIADVPVPRIRQLLGIHQRWMGRTYLQGDRLADVHLGRVERAPTVRRDRR